MDLSLFETLPEIKILMEVLSDVDISPTLKIEIRKRYISRMISFRMNQLISEIEKE